MLYSFDSRLWVPESRCEEAKEIVEATLRELEASELSEDYPVGDADPEEV